MLKSLTAKTLFITISLATGFTFGQNPIKRLNMVKENNFKEDSVTVIGVGDIMLGTIIPSEEYLPPNNDCSPLLKPLSGILKDADVTFGNLEGVFTDNAEDAKICKDTNYCYVYGMPSKYVYCLSEAGFNLISLANNHAGDFGSSGRINTIKKLKDAKINYAGLISCPSVKFIRNGIRFGFCAFARNESTCNLNDYRELQKIVKDLDKDCDIVIVSFHGGG